LYALQAYEGKGVDEATFYSCMKDILGADNNSLLEDFVNLIRPEDSSDVLSFDEPANKEDFPFNVDRKKSKSSENPPQLQLQQQQQQQQKQLQQPLHIPQAAPAPVRPSATLNNNEVIDLVKIAVNEKAKVTRRLNHIYTHLAQTRVFVVHFFIYFSLFFIWNTL
jgi:hypothetical protein